MTKKIFQNLDSKISKFLSPNSKIILGLSGGSDSVALLNLFQNSENNYNIIACHVNHGIDIDQSRSHEKFVKKLCKKTNVKLLIKKIDIPKLSQKHKLGIEEMSRIKRREFFEESLNKFNASKIVLGHHLDDQAETFIMRLIRGTSLVGLESIKELDGYYYRPMISIEKNIIIKYLKNNNLQWVEDLSNSDSKFTRNFIRANIIPLIKQLNPNFNNSIKKTIKMIGNTNTFLNNKVDKFIKNKVIECKNIKIINIEELIKIPKALNYAIISKILKEYFSLKVNLIHKNIEDVYALILSEKPSGQVFIKKNIIVEKGYKKLYFYDLKRIPKNNFKYEIKQYKSKDFDFFKILFTTKLDKENYTYFKINSNDNIIIRTFKNGDKIFYTKKNKSKKLQDIFVNEKIPKLARHFIPLLLVGNEIIKVPFVSAKSVRELTSKTDNLIGIRVTSNLLKKII